MKVAVSSTGKTLDSEIDPRFGRAAYFLVVDTETMDLVVIENENVSAGSGAGISAAKLVTDAGAEAVISGNCGPNAERTLSAAGVDLYTGIGGKVAEAIESLKSGKLIKASGPSVGSHFGSQG